MSWNNRCYFVFTTTIFEYKLTNWTQHKKTTQIKLNWICKNTWKFISPTFPFTTPSLSLSVSLSFYLFLHCYPILFALHTFCIAHKWRKVLYHVSLRIFVSCAFQNHFVLCVNRALGAETKANFHSCLEGRKENCIRNKNEIHKYGAISIFHSNQIFRPQSGKILNDHE